MSFNFSSEHILAHTECSQELGFFFFFYESFLVLVILWIFSVSAVLILNMKSQTAQNTPILFSGFIHTFLPLFYSLFLHICVFPSIHPSISNIPKQKWVCKMLLNNVMQESLVPTVVPASGTVETAAAHFHHWSKAWAWAPGGQVAIPARVSGPITVSQLFPPFACSKITEWNPTVLFCAFLRKPRWALKVCESFKT